MSSRRGGARKGSGRKPKSQTLGKPGQQKNQPSLVNFFGSQNTDITVNPTIAEEKHEETKINDSPTNTLPTVEAPQTIPNYDADPNDYEETPQMRGKKLRVQSIYLFNATS